LDLGSDSTSFDASVIPQQSCLSEQELLPLGKAWQGAQMARWQQFMCAPLCPGRRYNFFTGCPKAKTCTIILRGGAEQFMEETERSLHDAIMIVRRAIKVLG
jgi:hypothetical protein